MYIVKITFIMPYIDNNIKNANINPRKIANFHKFAKRYTRENIYVHSNTINRLGKACRVRQAKWSTNEVTSVQILYYAIHANEKLHRLLSC